MNVHAIKDKDVYILEVNPRASRTVPFVAKATGVPIAKVAARAMAGEKIADLKKYLSEAKSGRVAVKEAVFLLNSGVDIILGPEMKSTGRLWVLTSDFRALSRSLSRAAARWFLRMALFSSLFAIATKMRW